jgi:hypothetical protein
MLGGSLSALDAKRSAKLILELIEPPGRWDGWTRVGALENLLLSGVSLQLDKVLKILAMASGRHPHKPHRQTFGPIPSPGTIQRSHPQ